MWLERPLGSMASPFFYGGMKVERMFQALISRHARWSSDTPLEVRKGLGVFS